MIAVEILLGIAAAWAVVSVFVLGKSNLDWPTDGGGVKFGLAFISFILALGFLGMVLK